jgi:hypothetical protein
LEFLELPEAQLPLVEMLLLELPLALVIHVDLEDLD